MADEYKYKKLSEVQEIEDYSDSNIVIEKNGNIFKVPSSILTYISDETLSVLFTRAEKLGLINQQVVLTGGLEITEIKDWQYSEDGGVSYDNISIPHTCNAVDATSVEYFRGIRKYKFNFSIPYSNKVRYMIFEKVGQRCNIYLNNALIATHDGGYTPFIIDLTAAVKGNNEIMIETDNSFNIDSIPISGKFNIENGIYASVYLLTSDTICFDPIEFGHDRLHITMIDINDEHATFRVNAKIIGTANPISIKYYLRDHTGSIVENSIIENLELSDVYNYSKTITLNDPHLWNGLDDPYLYTVELILYNGDYKVDTVSAKVGLKYYAIDETNGFTLNGKPYKLQGFGLIQDYPDKAIAMTKDDFDKDYQIIKESGANFLRLAYYPHDNYVFDLCDKLGIIVQTEAPWINHYGLNASEEYYMNIKNSLTEMINNFYNHTSIVFFGICDNLNNDDLDISVTNQQGDFYYDGAVEKAGLLYDYCKSLTNQHLIGLVTNDNTFKNSPANVQQWKYDWVSTNQYKGWDSGSIFDHFGEKVTEYHQYCKSFAVSEYGAGANIDEHSEDPLKDRKQFANPPHYEEYQNLLHESYIEQMELKKYLIFSAAWCLFDYARSGVNDGNVPFQCDKGLITRDRVTYKDSFFLYKALWNKSLPFVYITSRRFTKRFEETITIKVYSNCDKVSLYQNNVLIQTLDKATKCNVIWEFDKVNFTSKEDVFKAIGEKDGTSYTDIVNFKTTAVA